MATRKTETTMEEQMNTEGMRVSQDEEIARVINARYSINAQIAILRQKDTKPEEYKEFFVFAEETKAKVKAAHAAEAAAQGAEEEAGNGE